MVQAARDGGQAAVWDTTGGDAEGAEEDALGPQPGW